MIYLADCPFRIPHFTHHSADLSAFLDSAFYFPHSAFRNSAFYQYPRLTAFLHATSNSLIHVLSKDHNSQPSVFGEYINKSLELNFWLILYDSIVFLCLQTQSLSKTKHNLTFRMGQKLSSKLLFRSLWLTFYWATLYRLCTLSPVRPSVSLSHGWISQKQLKMDYEISTDGSPVPLVSES